MATTAARQRVLMVSSIGLALVVLALVGVAALWPETAKRVGETDPAEGLAPETPMDWLEVPGYVAALAVCVAVLVRRRDRPDRRPLWVLVTFLLAWLLWRELPWDERILGDANTFSWSKYLGRPDVPLWAQVVLGGGSMLVTAWLVVYLVRHGGRVAALVVEKVRSASGWVFALGMAMLAAAQACDKYHTIDRHLGTNLAAWKAAGWLGYLEESLELVGPLVLLVACIVGAMEEPPARGRGGEGGDRSSGSADAPAEGWRAAGRRGGASDPRA